MRLHTLIVFFTLASACGSLRPAAEHAEKIVAPCSKAYIELGHTDEALHCLEQLANTESPSIRASFLLADLLDEIGNPAAALPYYFKVIELAHKHGGAPEETIAASMGIVAIRDRIEGFKDKFKKFMSELGDDLGRLPDDPGRLPREARFQLQNLSLGLARRAGQTDDAAKAVEHAGCLVHWRVAGPLGPFTWTEFDKAETPFSDLSSNMSVDLGPGRGLSPVRTVTSNTCFVTIKNPAMSLEGVTWSRTAIALSDSKTVFFRLHTNSAAVVYAGGKEIFRRDPRRAWPSAVSWFSATLPAGATVITVMLAAQNVAPSFSMTAVDKLGSPAFISQNPEMIASGKPINSSSVESAADTIHPHPQSRPIATYAQFKIALWWDDIELAFELADKLLSRNDDPAPILLVALAEATGADPSLPGEVAYEQARALDEQALKKETRLWRSRVNLADREFSEERTQETIEILNNGIELSPEEPVIRRRLVNILATQGWLAEASDSMHGLEQLLPTSCNTLEWKLSLARQQVDLVEARKLAEKLNNCDTSSPALAEELARLQDWDRALAERRRLAERESTSASLAFDVFEAASARSDLQEAIRAGKHALEYAQTDESIRFTLADAMAASGDPVGARKIIENGLSLAQSPRSSLASALASLERRGLLAEFRVNGPAVLKIYEAEQHEYDTSAVFVLDRAVHIVDPDGGTAMLVHTITHLLSDEAVEQHGELSLPRGAILLTARTIKSDGRILEPEEIGGKPTFSLPDLKPGDFIEIEYVLYSFPNQIYPGGFDTERFYFQDFQTAFHHSEIVVAAPDGMVIVDDPRGSCPPRVERSTGNLRVYSWKAKGVLPYPSEPLSPNATEYLPSIRVTARATWANTLQRMRELLADKDRPSRHIDRALSEATAGIPVDNHSERRLAIYNWVMEKIEPEDDMFEHASHIVVRKAGNRIRAFMAVMSAAGYPSRLALVKPSGADESLERAPQMRNYSELTVLVPEDGFVSLDQEQAPYGYLPPELRFRPAILVDNGERIETSGGAVPFDSQEIEVVFTLEADGTAIGTVREKLTGVLAARWRSEFKRYPKLEMERRFQEIYLSAEIRGAKLKSLVIKGLDSPGKILILEYAVEVPGFARVAGNESVIEIPFPITLVKQIGGLPARATPLVLASRIQKKISASIALPKGSRTKVLYAGQKFVKSNWGNAKRWHTNNGLKIQIGYEAHLTADRINPRDYPAFLAFAQSIDRLSNLELSVIKEKQPKGGK
ncbi:MAG: DUF3857 domain-containing protein [Proteobacteria bacterium]|nr:DUF3857 domain-containing protein [Pseudomonadota bacterium]